MRYLGGKFRLRKEIGRVLNSLRQPGQIYWEPFVGSAWVTTQIKLSPLFEDTDNLVFCSDVNNYLIEMWNALLDGWVPPESISEEEYCSIKGNKDRNPALTAFVGFGCSWGGKWFGGYARGEDRNWAREARDSLLNKISVLKKLNPVFFTYDFLIRPQPFRGKECLIYCDPPYKGTTGYDAVEEWNPNKFWNIVRALNMQGHTMVISEYAAPNDFECIASFETKTDLQTKNGKEARMEKLFMPV